ncbi:MAG: V-type ATP synthase subunit E [Bacillota bacterium]|nr:V-type ATP synthase subunit E [Bacillota bacterium]
MNTKPIIDLIRSEAKDSANKVILDAKDRAENILEHSSKRLQETLEQTRADAEREADLLEDRMRRMASLEQRNELVAKKRALIDEAFSKALDTLNNAPKKQVADLMTDLVLNYAVGDEALMAGEVNDGFFDEAFVKNLNNKLAEKNKKGALTMLAERVPGVCGLFLKSSRSEINCTFSALIETRREEFESKVADILFAKEND